MPSEESEQRHSRALEPQLILDPQAKAEAEVRNGLRQYDAALGAIQQAIDRRAFKLRPSLIQALHREALIGISSFAGNWRPAGVAIEGSHHIPVGAHMVAEFVEDMCDYVSEKWENRTAIHLAAYVMWRLNWIHPFADGNGRTSRMVSYVVMSIKVGAVLGGTPTAEDEQALKRARKARVPIVAVVTGPASRDLSLPFVLATDVVRVGAGEGFPIVEIAEAMAERLGDDAASVAARLPVLRGPVSEQIVRSFSRKNAVVAAVVFIPGADLPALTVNQIRMLVRLGRVHGRSSGRELYPEAVMTVGAGLGFRTVARALLDFVPVAGWAVKSTVAYTGTRALGQAAVWRLGSDVEVERSPGGHDES